MRKLDVVVAGLAVVDVLGRPVHFKRLPRPGGLQLLDTIALSTGGNVSNVGIDLAKMGFRVAGVTKVGDDVFGRFIRQEYARHGIDTAGLVVDAKRQTSATIVGVGPDGERTFLHTRGCLQAFSAGDILKNIRLIQRARLLAYGYLGLLPEMERELPRLFRTIKKKTSAGILLDTGGNPRRNPRLLRSILPSVDFVIPSYEEAVVLTGKRDIPGIVRTLREAGAASVIGVKLGARGCFIATPEAARHIPPARVREVVDATGAGDAFVAGFLAATIRGLNPFAAAEFGNRVAASAVTAVGASTAIQSYQSYLR